ncbi:(4Fe-4S)-binding protein [Propionibacteriaceae bacterium Y1923]|uniref:(4Fe-4S)-binding protein n=1 Tax=Aestuariimicrobium sp. Y1814 TaxID=3418742 RepID=UPI003C1B3F48
MSDNGVNVHEALLAETVNQAGDAIIAIDREGIIRVWNQKCVEIFGWTPEQALGQSVNLIIPEKFRAGHDHGFGAAMSSGHLASDGKARLTRALTSSGEPAYVEMTFAVVNGADGAAVGAVAVARAAEKPGKPADPRDEKVKKLYTGPIVDVTFEGELCIHSGNCTGGMPSVFDTSKRPWINPTVADTPEGADLLRRTVANCPSGALQIVEHEHPKE